MSEMPTLPSHPTEAKAFIAQAIAGFRPVAGDAREPILRRGVEPRV